MVIPIESVFISFLTRVLETRLSDCQLKSKVITFIKIQTKGLIKTFSHFILKMYIFINKLNYFLWPENMKHS